MDQIFCIKLMHCKYLFNLSIMYIINYVHNKFYSYFCVFYLACVAEQLLYIVWRPEQACNHTFSVIIIDVGVGRVDDVAAMERGTVCLCSCHYESFAVGLLLMY